MYLETGMINKVSILSLHFEQIQKCQQKITIRIDLLIFVCSDWTDQMIPFSYRSVKEYVILNAQFSMDNLYIIL